MRVMMFLWFVSLGAAALALALLGFKGSRVLWWRFLAPGWLKLITRRSWPALGRLLPRPAWERHIYWAGWRRGLLPSRWLMAVSALPLGLLLAIGERGAALFYALILVGGAAAVASRARAARTRFVNQLPDALDGLKDLVRAGYSLPSALVALVVELNQPVQAAFAALARGLALGLPFQTVMERLNQELAFPPWTMVGETILVGIEGGGNIVPLLQEQARTLRERLRAEAELKTLTAAGRMSGNLIGALVPAVLLFFWAVSPGYLILLFNTLLGRLLLGLSLGLEVVGLIWIRRLTRVAY